MADSAVADRSEGDGSVATQNVAVARRYAESVYALPASQWLAPDIRHSAPAGPANRIETEGFFMMLAGDLQDMAHRDADQARTVLSTVISAIEHGERFDVDRLVDGVRDDAFLKPVLDFIKNGDLGAAKAGIDQLEQDKKAYTGGVVDNMKSGGPPQAPQGVHWAFTQGLPPNALDIKDYDRTVWDPTVLDNIHNFTAQVLYPHSMGQIGKELPAHPAERVAVLTKARGEIAQLINQDSAAAMDVLNHLSQGKGLEGGALDRVKDPAYLQPILDYAQGRTKDPAAAARDISTMASQRLQYYMSNGTKFAQTQLSDEDGVGVRERLRGAAAQFKPTQPAVKPEESKVGPAAGGAFRQAAKLDVPKPDTAAPKVAEPLSARETKNLAKETMRAIADHYDQGGPGAFDSKTIPANLPENLKASLRDYAAAREQLRTGQYNPGVLKDGEMAKIIKQVQDYSPQQELQKARSFLEGRSGAIDKPGFDAELPMAAKIELSYYKDIRSYLEQYNDMTPEQRQKGPASWGGIANAQQLGDAQTLEFVKIIDSATNGRTDTKIDVGQALGAVKQQISGRLENIFTGDFNPAKDAAARDMRTAINRDIEGFKPETAAPGVKTSNDLRR